MKGNAGLSHLHKAIMEANIAHYQHERENVSDQTGKHYVSTYINIKLNININIRTKPSWKLTLSTVSMKLKEKMCPINPANTLLALELTNGFMHTEHCTN